MRNTLTLSLLTLLPLHTLAQCEVTIPASAVVIGTDGAHSVFGPQWVCGGTTVTLSSGFIQAYIEANANVTVETNLGAFMVRANSTLTISGFNNNVLYHPSATIIDNGSNTLLTECPEVVYDYSDAPDDGCDLSTGITAHAEPSITLWPSPADDQLNIDAGGQTLLGVTLLDLGGRSVRSFPAHSTVLDLHGLKTGRYVLALHTASGVEHRAVVVL